MTGNCKYWDTFGWEYSSFGSPSTMTVIFFSSDHFFVLYYLCVLFGRLTRLPLSIKNTHYMNMYPSIYFLLHPFQLLLSFFCSGPCISIRIAHLSSSLVEGQGNISSGNILSSAYFWVTTVYLISCTDRIFFLIVAFVRGEHSICWEDYGEVFFFASIRSPLSPILWNSYIKRISL